MPLFVKPNANGSSFGVTKVHAPEELPAAIDAAFAQGDEILVEECVTGREMGCGMLVPAAGSMFSRLRRSCRRRTFFDYEAKYTAGRSDGDHPRAITPEVKAPGTEPHDPRGLPGVPLLGVVRVDFIVTPEGKPYFIELNSIPGHERREHRPEAGPRNGHVARRTVRPDYRRHLPQMIEIDDKIVSADLLRECFACDIAQCKGSAASKATPERRSKPTRWRSSAANMPNYQPYMTGEGIESVERQGFMVVDEEGDLTTPLVDDAQCAYTYTENGVTLCAIEKAWLEGKTPFRKPISCHLYPIRLMYFSNGTTGLNYHRWSVCAPARPCGARLGIPVYKALREPIIRRFGEEFYKALEAAEEFISKQQIKKTA